MKFKRTLKETTIYKTESIKVIDSYYNFAVIFMEKCLFFLANRRLRAVGQANFIINKFFAPFMSSIFLLFPRKQFVAFSLKRSSSRRKILSRKFVFFCRCGLLKIYSSSGIYLAWKNQPNIKMMTIAFR